MPVIDAHHHFWRVAAQDQPWRDDRHERDRAGLHAGRPRSGARRGGGGRDGPDPVGRRARRERPAGAVRRGGAVRRCGRRLAAAGGSGRGPGRVRAGRRSPYHGSAVPGRPGSAGLADQAGLGRVVHRTRRGRGELGRRTGHGGTDRGGDPPRRTPYRTCGSSSTTSVGRRSTSGGWEPWADRVRQLAASPLVALKVSLGIDLLTALCRLARRGGPLSGLGGGVLRRGAADAREQLARRVAAGRLPGRVVRPCARRSSAPYRPPSISRPCLVAPPLTSTVNERSVLMTVSPDRAPKPPTPTICPACTSTCAWWTSPTRSTASGTSTSA